MHNEDNEEWFKCYFLQTKSIEAVKTKSKQEVVCMVMDELIETGFPEGPPGTMWKTWKEDEEDLIEFLDKYYPELK